MYMGRNIIGKNILIRIRTVPRRTRRVWEREPIVFEQHGRGRPCVQNSASTVAGLRLTRMRRAGLARQTLMHSFVSVIPQLMMRSIAYFCLESLLSKIGMSSFICFFSAKCLLRDGGARWLSYLGLLSPPARGYHPSRSNL